MRKFFFDPILYPLNRDLNKKWVIRYYDRFGKPCKVCGKLGWYNTIKEKEAERLIQLILNPLLIDEKQRTDLVSNLSDLVEYKKPFLKKKSYESYFSIIKKFSLWYRVAAAKNKAVPPVDYVRAMFEAGLSKTTIRNRVVALKGLVTTLVKNGKQKTNPFED